MVKALIFGYFGVINLGDEAILYKLYNDISDIGVKDITIITKNVKYTKSKYDCTIIDIRNLPKLVMEILKCNVIIDGGGGRNYNIHKGIFYILLITIFAKIFKKSMITYAIGVDNIKKSLNRKLVSYVYNYYEYINVRDTYSKKNLEQCNIKKRIIVTSDPVFNISLSKKEDNYIIKEIGNFKSSKKMIGVSFVNVNNSRYNEIKKYYCDIIGVCIENGYKVLIIPMAPGEGDLDSLEKIEFEISNKEMLKIIYDEIDITILNEIFKMVDLSIGMRLHFLIFSAINKVPFASIIRNDKVRYITDYFKQKTICYIDQPSIENIRININQFLNNNNYIDIDLLNNIRKVESSNSMMLRSFIENIMQ